MFISWRERGAHNDCDRIDLTQCVFDGEHDAAVVRDSSAYDIPGIGQWDRCVDLDLSSVEKLPN